MITIKAETADYGINFPESIKEIKADVYNNIFDGINIPENYVIIALAFKVKVFDFAMQVNGRGEQNFGVVPILAKAADKDLKYLNAKVGDKLIIPRSAIERGVHITVPVSITSDNAAMYFDTFKELPTDIIRNTNNKVRNQNIVLLQFKIVPVTDISASQAIDNYIIDPFVVEE